MTQPQDPIDVFLDAYFDYLEGTGDEPSLDDLDQDQRLEAEEFVASMTDARGIDPEASRPSIAALRAHSQTGSRRVPEDAIELSMRTGLRESVDGNATVTRDVAAISAGLASCLIVRIHGVRIRVVVDFGRDISEAFRRRVSDVAGVFGAFPDSAAVLLVVADRPAKGAIIDRNDVVTAIEIPSGITRPPRVRRLENDPVAACLQFVNEVNPTFGSFDHHANRSSRLDEILDPEHLASSVVDEIADVGRRARIVPKREAWTQLSDRDKHGIAALLRKALRGSLTDDQCHQYLDQLVEEVA